MTLGTLKQIAGALAVQFGKSCEVVIYDLAVENLDNALIYIENGYITNREKGGGPSQVVLEAFKKDPAKLRDRLGYLTRTDDGKTLKSSTMFIREDEGGPIRYILGINYDITPFLYCGEAFRSLISEAPAGGEADKEKPGQIFTNVSDLLDSLIEQSVALVGKPAAFMTKEEKIAAIRFLDDSGAFLITKSGDKVAQYFGISKFTLYNYLKAQ